MRHPLVRFLRRRAQVGLPQVPSPLMSLSAGAAPVMRSREGMREASS